MITEERTVSTGKKDTEEFKEKTYTLEVPESLEEAIDLEEGDDSAVLEAYRRQRRADFDNKVRAQLNPSSATGGVPKTAAGAMSRIGRLFAIGNIEGAAAFYTQAVEIHPELDSMLSSDIKQLLGV